MIEAIYALIAISTMASTRGTKDLARTFNKNNPHTCYCTILNPLNSHSPFVVFYQVFARFFQLELWKIALPFLLHLIRVLYVIFKLKKYVFRSGLTSVLMSLELG
jgi:hypothetical protein